MHPTPNYPNQHLRLEWAIREAIRHRLDSEGNSLLRHIAYRAATILGCYQSRARMSLETGISKRTIHNRLKLLTSHGPIIPKKAFGKTTTYTLPVEQVASVLAPAAIMAAPAKMHDPQDTNIKKEREKKGSSFHPSLFSNSPPPAVILAAPAIMAPGAKMEPEDPTDSPIIAPDATMEPEDPEDPSIHAAPAIIAPGAKMEPGDSTEPSILAAPAIIAPRAKMEPENPEEPSILAVDAILAAPAKMEPENPEEPSILASGRHSRSSCENGRPSSAGSRSLCENEHHPSVDPATENPARQKQPLRHPPPEFDPTNVATAIIPESAPWIKEWNEANPQQQLTPAAGISENSFEREGAEMPTTAPGNSADEIFNQYQTLRAKMTPPEHYSPEMADFAAKWAAWKKEYGLYDFPDLIETCISEITTAPGEPDTIFVDETQDMDPLEMTLIRKWGQSAQFLVVVGDPDQCIYSWRGTEPQVFLHPEVPKENLRMLQQSFRIPEAVHAYAQAWINRCPGRAKIQYRPPPHPGEVRTIPNTYRQPDEVVRDARRYVEAGKTVMFIASCSYMVDPIVQELRRQGLPFHNPLRTRNGSWNPLALKDSQTSTTQRILAFLNLSENGTYSASDVRSWGDMVKVRDTLQGHSSLRQLLDELDDDAYDPDGNPCLSPTRLHEILKKDTLRAALTADVPWLLTKITSSKSKPAEYPAAVLRAHGPDALRTPPLCIPGTIHSVKGGESDVVYLFPDLSWAASQEWHGNAQQRAAIHRLFYVGMTRARDTLVICQPHSQKLAADFWRSS